jgi:uncharacterized protein YecE (DUF72 family)
MPESTPPRVAIGPFVYVRFHGTSGKYAGRYSDTELGEWAAWLAGELRRGRDCYAYFNNDREGHAVTNARTLRNQIELIK